MGELSQEVADEDTGAVEPRAERAVAALDAVVDRLARVRLTSWITLVVVVGCVWFVGSVLHPRLILTDTLPTGGDMGAHVWSPVFLRDHLLNHGKLVGWSPDWYAGFPAFQFYMVLPSLAVVLLYRSQPLGAIAAVAAVGLAIARWRATSDVARRRLLVGAIAAAGVAIATVGMPYGVAFKIVAISGLVTLPVSAWALGKLSGLPFPAPAIFAVATVPFLFDRSFNIYGGNIASTMAGEFAFSMSLSLALLYLGFAIHALDTGRHRGWAALLLALSGLCHLFPAVWAGAVTVMYFATRVGRSQIKTMLTMLPVGGLLGAFWALPFFWKRTYLNDMGWGKLGDFRSNLLTRAVLNPANILRDSPPLEVVFGLAVVGLVLSLLRRNRLGVALGLTATIVALIFIHLPEGRLWNGRILPFYYLSLYLLAAIGLIEAVRLVVERPWARWLAAYIGGGLVIGEVLRYLVEGSGYAHRVGQVLPGPGASSGVALVVAVVAVLLASRDGGPKVWLAIGAEAVWLAGIAIPESWWVPAHGGHGFFGVAAESVLRPSAYALAHVLQYPAAYVLIGLIVVELLSFLTDMSFVAGPAAGGVFRWSAGPAALAIVLLVFGPALRSLPGGKVGSDGVYRWGPSGFQVSTKDLSYLPGWSAWNFNGYERKAATSTSGGYDEFYGLVQMVEQVAADPAYGCGRSMWEYGPRLEGYGTPMAPMLLPHFTDGCIGSMEGLYFEASSTTPYHFLNQSALSKQPSSAQRDLPYPGFDIDLGIRQLQLMGVRYYLAFSDTAVAAAQAHPDLREIASSGPWHMFLVADSELVVPLKYSPVVYTDVDEHQKDWLQPAAKFFNDPSQYDVLRAASGPAAWPRFTIPETAKLNATEIQKARTAAEADGAAFEDPTVPDPPREALPSVAVSGITTTDDTVAFDVDRIGVPVLVKTSYFPNWKVDGATGPYRVTPNLMVVIPTSTHVRLHYGATGIDYVSYGLTLIGVVLLALLFRRPSGPVRTPFWDPFSYRFPRRRAASTTDDAEDDEPGDGSYLPDDDDDWIVVEPVMRGSLADGYGH